MSMVCGLDLHRQQITFDALQVESGEVCRGRLWQPDRQRFRRWLRQDVAAKANGGPVALAVEGCTGCATSWRRSLPPASKRTWPSPPTRRRREAASTTPRPIAARPACCVSCCRAATCPSRGFRRRLSWNGGSGCGFTSRSWTSAPSGFQRIHAELYQHGVAVPEGAIRSEQARALLASDAVALSAAARQRITVGYRMIEATDAQALPLRADLQSFGRRQPACRALADAHYGIGGLIAVAVWSELGDCRRFTRSMQVVRHTGLDVTVDASDRRRAGGFLSRQGPETLRWALYEAAKNASRHTSPDNDYYAAVKSRHDGKLAAISVARQLARRCYHTLRSVDPEEVYAIPA